MRRAAYLLILLSLVVPAAAFAQATLVPDTTVYAKAKVLAVSDEKNTTLPGTDTLTKSQTLKVEVLDGPEKGKVVTFKNDYTVQLSVGDVFFLRHISSTLDPVEYYSVADPYRLNVLLALAIAFILLIFTFGGVQGIRGLASLMGSLVLIFLFLIPGILKGYQPLVVAVGVSSLIIVVGSYITHGFNKTTTAAVIGMIATVIFTGLAAYWAVHAAQLSGFTSQENVFLNFNTRGMINMVGLLLGGIMIGLLGVLYDIAIGQAISVEELYRAGSHMTRAHVYRRAIRIGREHIGALVNTLAIAYVGAALPLLLLITQFTDTGVPFILNSELVATEIIRVLIGSIGLILAVPITTFIATYMLSHMEGRSAASGAPGRREHGHSGSA